MIRHSLVIPAYNEARLLPRLLDSVDVARSRYQKNLQVIVADNASTDATAAIAAARGCEVARVEKRRIAAARNGGARLARGESACFIDADSSIHPETFNAIDQALARPDVVGGATGVFPERWSVGIAFTWMVMLPVVFVTGMDTGAARCAPRPEARAPDERESHGLDAQVRPPWRLALLHHGDPAGRARDVRRSARTKLAQRYWYTDDR